MLNINNSNMHCRALLTGFNSDFTISQPVSTVTEHDFKSKGKSLLSVQVQCEKVALDLGTFLTKRIISISNSSAFMSNLKISTQSLSELT